MAARASASSRGYGVHWRRIRANYLRRHPTCTLCGAPSEVPDHWPKTRRELIDEGAPHPDADEHLRPLCIRCHNSQTAKHHRTWKPPQPRRRPAQPHPGLIGGGGGPQPGKGGTASV